MDPKDKVKPEPRKLGPPAKDRESFADESLDEPLDVDSEAYLRWLETGEGNPFRERSS